MHHMIKLFVLQLDPYFPEEEPESLKSTYNFRAYF